MITFHDSQQRIERIERVAKLIDRPEVMPYRSSYSPANRRRIEHRLQWNVIQGMTAAFL